MACRAVEEACVKVGQTFLSALHIVLFPECRQKKGVPLGVCPRFGVALVPQLTPFLEGEALVPGDGVSEAKGDPIDSAVLIPVGGDGGESWRAQTQDSEVPVRGL